MSIRSTVHLPEWRSRSGRAGDADRAWRRSRHEVEAEAVRRAAERLATAQHRIC